MSKKREVTYPCVKVRGVEVQGVLNPESGTDERDPGSSGPAVVGLSGPRTPSLWSITVWVYIYIYILTCLYILMSVFLHRAINGSCFQIKMKVFVLCEHFPWAFLAGVVRIEDGGNDTLFWFLAQVTAYSDSSVASREELSIFVHQISQKAADLFTLPKFKSICLLILTAECVGFFIYIDLFIYSHI